MSVGKLIMGSVCAAALLTVVMSSWYTVDQGERGVILNYGAIGGEVGPGLHFKIPMVQSIEKVSIQTQNDAFTKTDNEHDFRMQAYSKDQQPATVGLSITYHVTSVSEVYAKYGSIDNMEKRIIDRRAYEQLKNVFGQFNAVEAIQQRGKLNAEVFQAIQKSISGPFVIESIQVEDIQFSDTYEKAVEARMEATVKQQQAEAEAAATRTRAEAKAYSVKVAGDAEASAIKARGDALRENPGLPTLVAAEKWDGKLPTTMVPGNSVPFIKVAQ